MKYFLRNHRETSHALCVATRARRNALHRDCTSNLDRDKKKPVRDDSMALKDFRESFLRLRFGLQNSIEDWQEAEKPFSFALL